MAVGYLAAIAPVIAQERQVDKDATCFLIALGMSANKDPTIKEAWSLGTTFFFGRVDALKGSAPAAQLVDKAVARHFKLTEAEQDRDLERCALQMEAAGGLLGDIGKRLKAQGRSLESIGR